MKFNHDRIETLVLGRLFRQPQTTKFFLVGEEASQRYRDVVHVQLDEGEAWVFDYGVLILWGVEEEKKRSIIKNLQEFVEDSLEKAEYERYRFVTGATEHRIHQDTVLLAGDSPLDRLTVSHALAQSIKLAVFEEKAQQVIEENAYVPRALAKDGKAPLNRKALARQRGILFSTKSDIVLNFSLLDTPEFFWDYPELEALYLLVARYLDVIPRVHLLSKKLETIHELLDMLASEQNHKHSSFLEWIIIILIAVEIVMALIEKLI